MGNTLLLNLEYPEEFLDPYWTKIIGLYAELDQWIQSNFEDKNFAIGGGGLMNLNPSTGYFSWSEAITIKSARSNTLITIAASNLTVADGQVMYVTVPIRPITTQSLALTVGALDSKNKNQIAVGVRIGDKMSFFGKINQLFEKNDNEVTYVRTSLGDAWNAAKVIETLSLAKAMTPNGVAASVENKIIVNIPKGLYDFEAVAGDALINFDDTYNYMEVIGAGGAGCKAVQGELAHSNDIIKSTTIFKFSVTGSEVFDVLATCTNLKISGIHFQMTNNNFYSFALMIKSESEDIIVENCSFERPALVMSGIIGATNANPCVLELSAPGVFFSGMVAEIDDVVGMSELNGTVVQVNYIDNTHVELIGVDSTGYGSYSSGGSMSHWNAGEANIGLWGAMGVGNFMGTLRDIHSAGSIYDHGLDNGGRFEGCTFLGTSLLSGLLASAKVIDCNMAGWKVLTAEADPMAKGCLIKGGTYFMGFGLGYASTIEGRIEGAVVSAGEAFSSANGMVLGLIKDCSIVLLGESMVIGWNGTVGAILDGCRIEGVDPTVSPIEVNSTENPATGGVSIINCEIINPATDQWTPAVAFIGTGTNWPVEMSNTKIVGAGPDTPSVQGHLLLKNNGESNYFSKPWETQATFRVTASSDTVIAGANLNATIQQALNSNFPNSIDETSRMKILVPAGIYNVGEGVSDQSIWDINQNWNNIEIIGELPPHDWHNGRTPVIEHLKYPSAIIKGNCYAGGSILGRNTGSISRNVVFKNLYFYSDYTGDGGGGSVIGTRQLTDDVTFENCVFEGERLWLDYFGAGNKITGITAANPAVLTFQTNPVGVVDGDIIHIPSIGGGSWVSNVYGKSFRLKFISGSSYGMYDPYTNEPLNSTGWGTPTNPFGQMYPGQSGTHGTVLLGWDGTSDVFNWNFKGCHFIGTNNAAGGPSGLTISGEYENCMFYHAFFLKDFNGRLKNCQMAQKGIGWYGGNTIGPDARIDDCIFHKEFTASGCTFQGKMRRTEIKFGGINASGSGSTEDALFEDVKCLNDDASEPLQTNGTLRRCHFGSVIGATIMFAQQGMVIEDSTFDMNDDTTYPVGGAGISCTIRRCVLKNGIDPAFNNLEPDGHNIEK